LTYDGQPCPGRKGKGGESGKEEKERKGRGNRVRSKWVVAGMKNLDVICQGMVQNWVYRAPGIKVD